MITAGQRVQVIKRDPATGRGVLQFGTELVVGGDGSIAGLLGASPGASTAVSAMLDAARALLPGPDRRLAAARCTEAIPSYGRTALRGPRAAGAGARRHDAGPGDHRLTSVFGGGTGSRRASWPAGRPG